MPYKPGMSDVTVIPVPCPGAEDVVVAGSGADEGSVYTGTEDGSVFRVSHDGRKVDRVAHTGGRPLGIEIDMDGRLLECDAHLGVLRIDTRDGAIEAVTDRISRAPMMFFNNAAIVALGQIGKFDMAKWQKVIDVNLTGTFLGMQAVV